MVVNWKSWGIRGMPSPSLSRAKLYIYQLVVEQLPHGDRISRRDQAIKRPEFQEENTDLSKVGRISRRNQKNPNFKRKPRNQNFKKTEENQKHDGKGISSGIVLKKKIKYKKNI